ncbi:MAG: ATP synthase F0 subunit B [Terracidiphilus sp.]
MRDSTAQSRFSARPFSAQPFSFQTVRFAVLAAFLVAVAAMPFRVTAQQAAPAARQTPASATSGAAGPEAANTQEAPKPEANEEDAYLHSPAVKSIARMLHLSLQTADNLFMGINFAIIVFGIGIPLFRWLPRFLRNRSETVRADIESARKATEDAGARLSAIEAKLSGLDGEIAQIRAQVEAESLEDEARIKSTITEESARIVAAAEQEVDASAAQARRGLRHFAADLAIGQAARQLVFTPETDQALIAEFLSNVAPEGKPKKGEPSKDESGSGAHAGGQN